MNTKWPTAQLGSVLRLHDTSVPSTQLTEINLAGVYSFGHGLFKRGPMSPGQTTYKSYNCLVTDDFVISQPKAWEGALARVTPEFEGWYLSPVFPTFRPSRDLLDPRYLEWFCKRRPVWTELQRKSRGLGARRESVSPDQFLSLDIPLPELTEQQRIVARIEDLAAKIEEARGLRKQTTEDSEALIVSTHLRFAGQCTRKLGDLLALDECQVGVTPTGEYPQVGVRGFGGGLFPKGTVSGTETTYRAFNQLYEGALVLSQVKGWEGAVGVCGSNLAGWFVSPEYRTFRCIPSEARPDYLAVLVRTEWFWGRLKDVTRGVGARRERTRPEQFLDLQMPMPDLAQQEAAKGVFAEVGALKVLQADTITELDALMPSILDKAFRGEL